MRKKLLVSSLLILVLMLGACGNNKSGDKITSNSDTNKTTAKSNKETKNTGKVSNNKDSQKKKQQVIPNEWAKDEESINKRANYTVEIRKAFLASGSDSNQAAKDKANELTSVNSGDAQLIQEALQTVLQEQQVIPNEWAKDEESINK